MSAVLLFLLKVWIAWHFAWLLVCAVRRTPARWWIRAGLMWLRIWLYSRVWAGVVQVDGWVGYYWDGDRRRLYLSACPWLVLRLSLASSLGEVEAIWRGLAEMQRARGRTDPELAADLQEHVGAHLGIGTRGDAVVEEIADRLRGSFPGPRT